jgi:hypothetical protein
MTCCARVQNAWRELGFPFFTVGEMEFLFTLFIDYNQASGQKLVPDFKGVVRDHMRCEDFVQFLHGDIEDCSPTECEWEVRIGLKGL